MKLLELLSAINKIAKDNKLAKPYIVGGAPRDIVLKQPNLIKDIDITCGNDDSLTLAQKCAQNIEGSIVNLFNDGHARLIYEDYKIDFSNNFKLKNIDEILSKEFKIKSPNDMEKELYSRDFTINTLLMSLNLEDFVDITKRGVADIKDKVIDTILEPEITLGNDYKRVVRAIYLAAKLDFELSERVSTFIKRYGVKIIPKIKENYTKEKIAKALEFNKEKTTKLINELGLVKVIPQSGKIIDSIVGE